MFKSDRSNGLPDELVLLIFSYVELNDVPSIALVNKQFNSMINDGQLWEKKFKDQYPHLYKTLSQQNNVNWFKESYKAYKETNALIEFLNLLKDFEEKSSQIPGLSFTRPHTAAIALKKVLFNNCPETSLALYSRELSNPNVALGKIYTKLQSLDLINNAKKYHMDLIEPNKDNTKTYTLKMC
jgi:hypothetical protein